MNANEIMSALASKYQLEEGKFADYYNSHDKWCVTKRGAEKIADIEGISWELEGTDITSVSIAYRGKFTATGSGYSARVIHEIGSCYWASGKNTPETTHAPEMAWKRLNVRGVLAMVAPASGIYGSDEMSHDWHSQGATPPPAAAPAPQPTGHAPPANPTQLEPPQAAPASAPQAGAYGAPAAQPALPATNVDGTINYAADPRYPAASAAQKWFAKAIELPSDWAEAMGKFCEITRLERGAWEPLLFDHAGKFEGSQGWWWPSKNWATFTDVVFATKTYEGVTSSKAPFAMKILSGLREVVAVLERTGNGSIVAPDKFGVMQRYDIAAMVDGAPLQPTEREQPGAAPDFPAQSDFGQGQDGGYPDDVPF